MESSKKCGNCSKYFRDAHELCMRAEMEEVDGDSLACSNFTQAYDYDDEYCPCSTYGDYSPSNPWDAPGMSISDFI